jgi:hypothetical protein
VRAEALGGRRRRDPARRDRPRRIRSDDRRSSASIKLAGSLGAKVLYSNVQDNVGNGVWFDVDSGSDQPDEIIGNVVTGNSMRGIFMR